MFLPFYASTSTMRKLERSKKKQLWRCGASTFFRWIHESLLLRDRAEQCNLNLVFEPISLDRQEVTI